MINDKNKILIIIIFLFFVASFTVLFFMRNKENFSVEKRIIINSEEARAYEEIKQKANEVILQKNSVPLKLSTTNTVVLDIEEGKQLIAIQEKIDINKQEFIKSLAEKDYANAQKALENISLVSSDDLDFYIQKGRLAEDQNNLDEAIKSYNKAIDIARLSDSKSPAPYTFLGRIHVQKGDNIKAISVFKYGISQVPTYPDFYLMLSEVYKDIDIKESKLYRDKFEELIKKNQLSS
ncbi:hypothetical protein C4565_07550 [Candidatus Parcubacteria bacterium]|jgi:tetratricopeptide (TPR) repeat protein|nr:MAG: hypothetical protein C4565_07550 [Candidatus Parcubacteria bacterium]